jgi:hypothetical protein
MTSTLETHKIGGERGKAIELSLGISPLDDNVIVFRVPELAQTLTECFGAV